MRFRLNSKTIVISFAVLLLIYFVILPMGVAAGPDYKANLAQIWKQNFPGSNITQFSDITSSITNAGRGR